MQKKRSLNYNHNFKFKKEVSFLGFSFVDDSYLATATDNAYISVVEMIQKM